MWGRVIGLAAAVTLAVALAGVAAPERAAAGHDGRECGIYTKGSRDYRVRSQQLSCDKARRGTKRYLRSGEALTGFNCEEPAGRIEFFCKSGTKVYWALRL
jgi:hypothetical protein